MQPSHCKAEKNLLLNYCTVYQPTEHIYFPQLMQLSLGGGVQVTNERGIRMTTQHGGEKRIMLNDVPEGKYKVLINYF